MRADNILHLGVKELWGLARDPVMLVLIVYAFTLSIYSSSTAVPDTLHKAQIATVDEDHGGRQKRAALKSEVQNPKAEGRSKSEV